MRIKTYMLYFVFFCQNDRELGVWIILFLKENKINNPNELTIYIQFTKC